MCQELCNEEKTSISSLILYNGTLQFLTVLVLNTVVIVFNITSITAEFSDSSQVITLNGSLSAIIICRFLLNLRSIYPSSSIASSHSSTSFSSELESTIKFADSLLGNIGAPLRDDSIPWVSTHSMHGGWNDDGNDIWENESEKPVYSDEPLTVVVMEELESSMSSGVRAGRDGEQGLQGIEVANNESERRVPESDPEVQPHHAGTSVIV